MQNFHKIQISLKAFEYSFLEKASEQMNRILLIMNDIHISGVSTSEKEKGFHSYSFPIKLQKFIVIRSPHIDKKSRDQFQIKQNKILLNHKGYWSSKHLLFFLESLKNTQFYGIQMQIQIRSMEYAPRILQKTRP